jgi:hypothetical protein
MTTEITIKAGKVNPLTPTGIIWRLNITRNAAPRIPVIDKDEIKFALAISSVA